ncbi:NCS2 family permease [Novacetimonas hansenii]|uniref:NCS2 family permease n=1 Tax=Novacetimonas hansenii TaxID=436 RepID=UPI000D7CF51F|nr:NCS2 family permease [Novacetimonas hansenii]PYD73233.1 membrane transporter [Novacetimonas hansenii]
MRQVMRNAARGLDRYFAITRRGSTLGTEIVAGVTTFGAMAYIMAVNPAILSMAGLDHHDMIMTTIVASICGTLLMALMANLPIALAPAMSSNIIFAQVVVMHMGISPAVAFAMVFLGGIVFVLLALTSWRQKIIDGFPEPVVCGIRCAIGAFIVRIGMTTGGLAVPAHDGFAFGLLREPSVDLALGGLALALVLSYLRVPAAMLVSIVVISCAGLFVHGPDGRLLTRLPAHMSDWPHYPYHLLFAFDFHGFVANILVLFPVTVYFFLSDFFDATGTMMAVTQRATQGADGAPLPLGRKAFCADGAASVIGASLGTSTVSAYLESLVGVEAGGRTGLCAVVVAVLFALSSFFWPLITAIPAVATAPVLIVVGVGMLSTLVSPQTQALDDLTSPLLMVVITLMTGNFMLALACGLLLHTILIVGRRQWRRLTPMLVGLDIVFVIFLCLESGLQR